MRSRPAQVFDLRHYALVALKVFLDVGRPDPLHGACPFLLLRNSSNDSRTGVNDSNLLDCLEARREVRTAKHDVCQRLKNAEAVEPTRHPDGQALARELVD